MIVYDSKKWSHLFGNVWKTYRASYNLQQLSKFMFFIAIYVTGITIFNIHVMMKELVVDTVFFSLVGVILGLFMVFRLNTAYDRWWEGRKLWGKLVNDSRTLALNLNALMPAEEKRRRRFFVRSIANFAHALMWHLRDDMRHGEFIVINKRYTEDLENAKHVPNKIVSFMFVEVEHMQKENMICQQDKDRLNVLLQGFIDVLGACERIKKTPIPFSHSTFIKLFTMIYLAVLPFGLVEKFHYLTIPCVMIMAFALLGVEVISEEIENPFGLDANDLPTGAIADGIRESTYEILQVPSTFISPPTSNKEAEILT